MSFQSLGFALFFPAVSCIYFLLPAGRDNFIRNIWLLLAGYFFYMYGNPVYGIFLLYISLLTYILGLVFEKKKRSGVLIFFLFVHGVKKTASRDRLEGVFPLKT